MPFRTMAVLQSWVDEFAQQEQPMLSSIRVIPQDGDEDADTGLVAVRIPDSPTEIYIEPPTPATGPEWSIMFEPREQAVTLGASAVATISAEVAALADLCAFLQRKSEAFLRQDGEPAQASAEG
ncbi:hypothetical protein [Microbacterium sp. BK668]|uniref:hypothetical protein n=1 Tax=Microbacterium sp. BK668 TaxID=2512118 RepID=UPI0010622962|nr:hypothetical protein [Microbacterium sp. BK668]TDN87726.1 hypothetical protein EV279_3154 [Microbacterium sp. BK668]